MRRLAKDVLLIWSKGKTFIRSWSIHLTKAVKRWSKRMSRVKNRWPRCLGWKPTKSRCVKNLAKSLKTASMWTCKNLTQACSIKVKLHLKRTYLSKIQSKIWCQTHHSSQQPLQMQITKFNIKPQPMPKTPPHNLFSSLFKDRINNSLLQLKCTKSKCLQLSANQTNWSKKAPLLDPKCTVQMWKHTSTNNSKWSTLMKKVAIVSLTINKSEFQAKMDKFTITHSRLGESLPSSSLTHRKVTRTNKFPRIRLK